MKNTLVKYIQEVIKNNQQEIISEGLRFHIKENIPLSENIFRSGSKEFFNLFSEARKLCEAGKIILSLNEDKRIMEEDIGLWAIYEDKCVPLDYPMKIEEIGDIYVPEIFEVKNYIVNYDNLIVEKKKKKKKKERKKLNKPKRNNDGKSAYVVYVKDKKTGKIKKIKYGSPSMSRHWNDKERNKSFVARHGCGTERAGDRTSARYWSCRAPKDFSKKKDKPRFW